MLLLKLNLCWKIIATFKVKFSLENNCYFYSSNYFYYNVHFIVQIVQKMSKVLFQVYKIDIYSEQLKITGNI